MERQLKAGLAIMMISYFGACAPVSFDTSPTNKSDNVQVRCEGATCFYDVTEEKTVGEGLVDILIVNDNSGSMSFEQAKMATAFSGFLASIDKRDYRIAMTTTDVADTRQRIGTISNPGYNPPGPYNGNGALQDGRLIDFAPGLKFLDRSTANKQTLFDAAVRRPETLQCENSGFTQCPSGDERGIAALGLTIQNYMSQWARPTAHFAVIILADEDERGVSKYNPCNYSGAADKANCEAIKATYPFEAADEPQAVVDKFRTLYPSKAMSVYPLIVRPGDTACRTAQTGQVAAPMPVLGQEGYAYEMLRTLSGGILGNICESNYTSQLQRIGYTLANVEPMPFRCRPVNDQFDVLFNGVKQTTGFTVDFNTMVLSVTATLDPSTKITLKYSCAK